MKDHLLNGLVIKPLPLQVLLKNQGHHLCSAYGTILSNSYNAINKCDLFGNSPSSVGKTWDF